MSGITGAQSTVRDEVLRETAITVIRAMGPEPHGLVAVDFTYDNQGRPNPTEVQATRFYSSVLFLTEAGLNLPDIYADLGLTEHPPSLKCRMDPLPDGHVWLKALDCIPRLTTWDDIRRNKSRWQTF